MNVLVTVCNSDYYDAAKTLIASVHRTSCEVVDKIIVYDLGLTYQQIKELDSMAKVAVYPMSSSPEQIVPRFDWRTPKQHVYKLFMKYDLSTRGQYDWADLLFLDAGVCCNQSLKPIFDIIKRDHIFTVVHDIQDHNFGLNTIGRWTHQVCLERMEVTEDEKRVLQIHGGLFGFKANGYYQDLIIKAYMWGCKKEVILGSHDNHRHDQSILSILCTRAGVPVQPQCIYGEYRPTHHNPETQVLYVHRKNYNNHEGIRYVR